ncbi:hypothetical protein ACFQV8_07350 [Pseudonocardia benzenivorans]
MLVLASALVVFLLRDTLTTRSVEGRPYAVASGAAGIATAGSGTTTPSAARSRAPTRWPR